jgi:hypothetical protein
VSRNTGLSVAGRSALHKFQDFVGVFEGGQDGGEAGEKLPCSGINVKATGRERDAFGEIAALRLRDGE